MRPHADARRFCGARPGGEDATRRQGWRGGISAAVWIALPALCRDDVQEQREEFGLRFDAELGIEVLAVHFHGAGGDLEMPGDVAHGLALKELLQDFELALCENGTAELQTRVRDALVMAGISVPAGGR